LRALGAAMPAGGCIAALAAAGGAGIASLVPAGGEIASLAPTGGAAAGAEAPPPPVAPGAEAAVGTPVACASTAEPISASSANITSLQSLLLIAFPG